MAASCLGRSWKSWQRLHGQEQGTAGRVYFMAPCAALCALRWLLLDHGLRLARGRWQSPEGPNDAPAAAEHTLGP